MRSPSSLAPPDRVSALSRRTATPPLGRGTLLLAIAVVALLQGFLPYGPLLLYPFTLLSTWVHEMGHGLTALVLGGRFEQLQIFADASGLALTAVQKGPRQAAVALGGLIAPPLWGAALLALSRRLPRVLLAALSLALVLSLALWVRTLVGWASMAPLALGLALLARHTGPGGAAFSVQLIGATLALNTVTRMGYLFVTQGSVGGVDRRSDIAAITEILGGGVSFWGGLVAGISVILLLIGLWLALHAPRAARPTS